MKTLTIKMKSYAHRADDAVNNNTAPLILRMLLSSLGMLALIYVFLLGSMVYNIVERKSLEVEARTISSQVSDLEQSYLSMSNKVDMAYSESIGFKEVKATFATRKTLGSLPLPNTSPVKNEI